MKFIICFFLVFFSCYVFSQQVDYVDFKTAKADIKFGDLTKNDVTGVISYEFEILKNTDSIYIDANSFQNIKYVLDGQFSDSLYNGKQLIVKYDFKENSRHKIDIIWKTNPKKALYFVEKDGDTQIWSQGQGKYTSNWLPSFDDMNEKVEFDLTITFDKDYEVIANGKLTNKQINESTITWHYDMQNPMSSYLVALAIGKYDKQIEFSKSGIPLEMYYYPEDSIKFEPT